MKKAKDGRLIFDNTKDLTTEINRRIRPQLNAEIDKLHKTYDEQIAKVKEQATVDASTMMLPIIATSLYEAYGFGYKRIEKFVEYFNKHLECINDGITTADQYVDWCKEQGYKCLIVEAEDEEQNRTL